jgi:predicted deacetylase
MTGWLEPLREALDRSPRSVTFFFRDDDAGWRDERLVELLDLFARRGVPLDVGAIPVDLSPRVAAELRARAAHAPHLLGIHQHGYAHVNHEREGRPCEFGPSRACAAQLADLRAGRRRLEELLGPVVQPIFSPPWNRCTPGTGECLVRAGIPVLSRDRTAQPLDVPGLRELPVQVDWCKKRKGRRLGRAAVGELLAARARELVPLGVMLHHAEMEREDMTAVAELLDLVAAHSRARCLSMAAVLDNLPGEEAA